MCVRRAGGIQTPKQSAVAGSASPAAVDLSVTTTLLVSHFHFLSLFLSLSLSVLSDWLLSEGSTYSGF